MSFVRKRGGSHQLIETYREGGTVKQRVLANLGPYPTPAAAAAADPRRFGHLVGRRPDPKPDDTTPVVSTGQPAPPADPKELEIWRRRQENRRRVEREKAVGRPKRAELLQAFEPLVTLAGLINGPRKLKDLEEAFSLFDIERDAAELPKGLDARKLVVSVKQVETWLPAVYELLNARRPGVVKALSRAARWTEGKAKALEGLEELNELKGELADWRSKLDDLSSGLQEGASTQALIEKLDAFEEIDIDSAVTAVEDIEDNPDFPRGFGQD